MGTRSRIAPAALWAPPRATAAVGLWCQPVDAVVCGICGGSGAGKTTLTRRIVDRLGGEDVSVLAFDAYYRDLSHLPLWKRRTRNFDHPDSLDSALFVEHLDALRRGRVVDVPVYDYSTHTFSGHFQRVAPAPLLLVEGILLLAFSEVAERLDYSVFLDVPRDLRLQRRIERDIAERGRQPEHVERQFAATVAPMHDEFVQPHRHRADLIVTDPKPEWLSLRLLDLMSQLSDSARTSDHRRAPAGVAAPSMRSSSALTRGP